MPAAINPTARRTLWTLALLVAAAGALLWTLWDILAPFAVCLLLIYLLEPLVTLISRRPVFGVRLPRGAAVATIFGVVIGGLSLLASWAVPRLSAEVTRMANELPKHIDEVRQVYIPSWEASLQAFSDKYGLGLNAHKVIQDAITDLLHSSQMGAHSVTEFASSLVGGVFHTIMTTILVLIVTAFVLRDAPMIKDKLWGVVPVSARKDAKALTSALSRDLNGAIRGQLLICLINGILTTLGLLLLKIPFAVTIGLIAGVCSLIPVFGTVISTVPAVLVALTQSWLVAFEVVGVIMLIHLIEANYLNPKVMGHHVELHPAIVLTSLFIGEHFLGVAGLLLAVPIAAAARSIVLFVYGRFAPGAAPASDEPTDGPEAFAALPPAPAAEGAEATP